MQARDVSGGIHFHSPGHPSSSTPRPRQLPGDVRGFINRSKESHDLDLILSSDTGDPSAAGITVIAGTAGVGKTSFALRWAHHVMDRFPDGQLYANLRGYDPDPPATPGEVLHRFLTALGVPSRTVPADPEAAAALYRSLLADRRMLVFLDNAAAAGQVRPLLPGTASCLVIVTSRSRLSGLSVRNGARRLTLGPLAEADAVALLSTVTTGYRAADDAGELAELARLCARLPLALRIAAERAASRPRMGLEALIRTLRDESRLWEALSTDDEEEANAVRTVFAWSYRALTAEAARLFRLLGLHPGPDFGAEAAAALAGIGLNRARHLLDVLAGAHLLEQSPVDRYAFHDLLRAYATDQVQDEEAEESRTAALRRVLAWYLHSADAAQTWLNPQEPHIPLDPPDNDIRPADFSDYEEAMRWYERERANLLAATRSAETAGLDRTAWQLPAVLRSVHMLLNPFEEWLSMSRIGLRAARRLGDRLGEAELLESLGMACTQSHRLMEATEHHQATLAIRRELGDPLGEALALNDLGLLHLRQRRLIEAKERFGASRDLFREIGAVHWEAVVTANLAEVAQQLGQFADASDLAHRALAAHRELADQGGQGNALRILSDVQRDSGAPREALRSARNALNIARAHHNQMWEGYWLLALGRSQQACGDPAEALASYQRAAVLQRELGDRSREALAWQGAGNAYMQLQRYEDAADFHRTAATAHRELGDHWQLALALHGLATASRQLEDDDAARRHWAEALSLLADYNDPEAEALRIRIEAALRD